MSNFFIPLPDVIGYDPLIPVQIVNTRAFDQTSNKPLTAIGKHRHHTMKIAITDSLF
jgi:hypothetical protein